MSVPVNSLASLALSEGNTFTHDLKAGHFGQQSVYTKGKLADALAKAQSEFKPVNKSKTGKVRGTTKDGRAYEYEYKYADLSDILGMAVPALSKQGIAFSQPLRRDGDKLYVVTRLQLGDEVLEDAGLPVPTQVKPQELGTYLTYYRRYGVSTVLGIAADEDTDGPQEDKPSTSGQSQVGGAVPSQVNAAKRGRPAVLKESITVPKSSTVVAPEPPVQAAPPIANDSDVPDVIGDKPSSDQMAEIKKQLGKFEIDRDKLKTYVLKSTGRDSAKDLTKRQWDTVISNLTTAQSNGSLADLVK